MEKRWDFVKENKLCFNCLNGGHRLDDCRYRKRCTECNRKHNVLLHQDKPAADTDKKPDSVATTALCTHNSKSVAFPVVAVKIKGRDHALTTYAILDQCSDTTLVTKRLLNLLKLEGRKVPFSVDTVNGRSTDETSQMIDLELKSLDSGESFKIKGTRSVEQIPVKISSVASNNYLLNYTHLSDLQLHSATSGEINLLIGSDAPNCFVVHSTRFGNSEEPYAQKTPFGWTVVGPIASSTKSPLGQVSSVNLLKSVSNDELSAQMSQFWKYDFPDAIHSSRTENSVEDKIVERIVRPTVKKVDGRYLCKMPFRTRPQDIPNNRTLAETRMKYLCRKLQKDETVKAAYVKCMEGYIRDGYARKVSDAELQNDGKYGVCYVPHHAVTNPKKPGKVRVVFDCAAKYSGKSLNDHLYTGPDIVNTLLGVLFRFRQEPVAIVGDVEMMYLRIKVYPEDEKFLRIL